MWTFISTSGMERSRATQCLLRKLYTCWKKANLKLQVDFLGRRIWEYLGARSFRAGLFAAGPGARYDPRTAAVAFEEEASQTRDYCVAKNATRRAARPDPSLRKKRLFRMTIRLMTWTRILLVVTLSAGAGAQAPSSKEVEAAYPEAHALYLDLHQNPELSAHETQTAAKLAGKLRGLGYEV